MAENTKIQWCDKTASPWYGCAKVAAGCARCYAEALAKRNPNTLGIWGPNGTRVKSKSFIRDLRKWNREAEAAGRIVSVFPSLCDPFEDRPELQPWRKEMFAVADECPHIRLILLTKRPENIKRMWVPYGPNAADGEMDEYRPNVWLLTSVACQEDAERNIPKLLECRDLCPVLGVSAEPLLGPVDLSFLFGELYESEACRGGSVSGDQARGIANRRLRSNLESRSKAIQSMEGSDGIDPMQAPPRGEPERDGLLANSSDDRRTEGARDGASAGVAALQGADPGRNDNQSQKREEGRQSPGESGTGNCVGADDSFQEGTQKRRPDSREESPRQTNSPASRGHSTTATGRRAIEINRDRLRGGYTDGVENRSRFQSRFWVIVGGESGPDARPCNVLWIRQIIHQCRDAGEACFVKQLGSQPIIDSERFMGEDDEPLKDPKGGDPAEWPEDMRVREYPTVRRER